jgi:hypothetical protein
VPPDLLLAGEVPFWWFVFIIVVLDVRCFLLGFVVGCPVSAALTQAARVSFPEKIVG